MLSRDFWEETCCLLIFFYFFPNLTDLIAVVDDEMTYYVLSATSYGAHLLTLQFHLLIFDFR